jgi:hypothetical protein
MYAFDLVISILIPWVPNNLSEHLGSGLASDSIFRISAMENMRVLYLNFVTYPVYDKALLEMEFSDMPTGISQH